MRQKSCTRVPAVGAALALFSAALVLTGCEQSPTDAYEVSGIITDERTGDPIEGATVTFVSDTGYSAATTTGGNGEYGLGVETDYPYGQIRAEAAGYRTGEASVYFDATSRRIDLALIPGRASE